MIILRRWFFLVFLSYGTNSLRSEVRRYPNRATSRVDQITEAAVRRRAREQAAKQTLPVRPEVLSVPRSDDESGLSIDTRSLAMLEASRAHAVLEVQRNQLLHECYHSDVYTHEAEYEAADACRELRIHPRSLKLLESAVDHVITTIEGRTAAQVAKAAESQLNIDEYYRSWASEVISTKRLQAKGKETDAPAPTQRTMTVPRQMNLSAALAARDALMDSCEAIAAGSLSEKALTALTNSSFIAKQGEAFVGLWYQYHEEGMVDYLLALGSGIQTAEAAQTQNSGPRVYHKWVMVDGKLAETAGPMIAVEDGVASTSGDDDDTETVAGSHVEETVDESDEIAAVDDREESVTWWHDGALTKATISGEMVLEVSKRTVEKFFDINGTHQSTRDQLVVERVRFDASSREPRPPPIACTRSIFKRVVASDVIGDLRVRNAWRTAHAAAEAAPDDSDADVDVDDSPSLEWMVTGLGSAHLPAGAGIRVPPPVTVPLASPAPPPAKLAPRGEFNLHEWMDSLKDVEAASVTATAKVQKANRNGRSSGVTMPSHSNGRLVTRLRAEGIDS